MEIYLLRHGIAEDSAPTGRDPDRRLTEEGRAKLRRVLERAHRVPRPLNVVIIAHLYRISKSYVHHFSPDFFPRLLCSCPDPIHSGCPQCCG